MPVAAIEALVALLAATPSLTTISETLDLLNKAAATLKHAVANPISLSAGTDLFTRYIVTSLRPGASTAINMSPHQSTILGTRDSAGNASADFAAVRAHLLANGRLFAQRAKAARQRIAVLASPFIQPHTTILTNGGSRVVGAVLRQAAKSQTSHNGSPRFRVIWVTARASLGPSTPTEQAAEGAETIRALRQMQVPVAEIAAEAVAYVMEKVSMALVGAEGVVETGGVVSRLGTYQLCTLARAKGRSVYVVAESHKFVRSFPLGEMDLGVDQCVLNFHTDPHVHGTLPGPGPRLGLGSVPESTGEQTPTGTSPQGSFDSGPAGAGDAYFFSGTAAGSGTGSSTGTGHGHSQDSTSTAPRAAPPAQAPDAVDYTPPHLITALVTEAGVLTPSAVSEELVKIWY